MPAGFGYSTVAAIQVADSGSADAFGRLRSADPYTLFDSKLLYDNQPFFWDEAQTSGSGTSTAHSTALCAVTMSVTASTAGTRVRQSKQRFNYQPGKSQLIFMTAVLGTGASGITRRVGYYDDNDGLFFELSGTELRVVRRSNVTGSPVNTFVSQSNWNLDKMDGTGRSKVNLDTSKTQIFVIDFEWLGVGRVRFGFVVDGVICYCHEMKHANVLTTVYMSRPNLPCRYEIVNSGTGAAASIVCICSTVITEGGREEQGAVLTVSTGNTQVDANVAGTIYACIGIRLKTTHLSATIRTVSMAMLGSTVNDNFEWRLYLNPTIAGAFTYSDVTNSACQAATGATANTISGGTVLNAGPVRSESSLSEILVNSIPVGSTIAGVRDELVLAVMPIAGAANLDIYASLTWRELL